MSATAFTRAEGQWFTLRQSQVVRGLYRGILRDEAYRGQAAHEQGDDVQGVRSVVGVKSIADIDRNDVVEFHDRIRSGNGKHGRTASYKAVNKKLSDIRTFFRWCKEQRNVIFSNPAEGFAADVSQSEREEAQDRRRPFTTSELQTIFQSRCFAGVSR